MRTLALIFALGTTAAVANPAGDEPILCVDTLDCGGICGTEHEVQIFLAQCNAGQSADPAGPCMDDCWSACRHASDANNNPNLVACTQECMTIDCPGPAAQSGLQGIHGSDECPVPNPEAICFALYDPVVCGQDDCTYSNGCVAAAAGFAGGQCKAVNDPVVVEL